MRLLLALLLTTLPAALLAQATPTRRPAQAAPAPKAPARATTANDGDATVAPGETVELGRASTDYNGRASNYKKPARQSEPTDTRRVPAGQGISAAPGEPVQPVERARDDYNGRPVPATTKPVKTTTRP
ncbi:hypothetical protein [Hymenobacter jeollabukensis]|uniref:Uncharacterized protein n=1 Tax=Hymenobacter jeollabukensis TaxID=2025313 RepID=A0A5R8WT43_9BACT|nr:hypothetical protein [Hymenobacter jeollabukensis]TLM94039.1 hypothetical protein FDY95_08410 [Hymenobacter jeollabukensis]